MISEEEQSKLTDSYYLKFVKNQYSLSGRPKPFNATITVKIGKQDVPTILEETLDCFQLPVNIRVDFWAVLTSFSR